MLLLFFIFLVLLVACVVMLVIACVRIMQYDSILGSIVDMIDEYGADLAKLSSGEMNILREHPEVYAFHKRNMQMRGQIEAVVNSLSTKKESRKKPLPRPDME